MSFHAIEKYMNTRLLQIPQETGRHEYDTKEHVHKESPLTSCALRCT